LSGEDRLPNSCLRNIRQELDGWSRFTKAPGIAEASLSDNEYICQSEQAKYACGELNRRLERWDAARSYYQTIHNVCKKNEYIEKWAREQEKILPNT
jgi:hypothetical protein